MGPWFPIDHIRSYADHLEESYLLARVPLFSYKLHERSRNPSKVYATDVGLRNAVTFRLSEDRGWLAETLVHQQLAREPDTSIFYFRGKRECDFVVWRDESAERVVQVCYGEAGAILPPRELDGLIEAKEATRAKEGVLITADQHGPVPGGDGLRMTTLLSWLAEEPGRPRS